MLLTDLLQLFLSLCSIYGTFSRHGKAQASLALHIWLNENVLFISEFRVAIGSRSHLQISL